jgi:hypothetical protein
MDEILKGAGLGDGAAGGGGEAPDGDAGGDDLRAHAPVDQR